jgi:hypothetical protein
MSVVALVIAPLLAPDLPADSTTKTESGKAVIENVTVAQKATTAP